MMTQREEGETIQQESKGFIEFTGMDTTDGMLTLQSKYSIG